MHTEKGVLCECLTAACINLLELWRLANLLESLTNLKRAVSLWRKWTWTRNKGGGGLHCQTETALSQTTSAVCAGTEKRVSGRYFRSASGGLRSEGKAYPMPEPRSRDPICVQLGGNGLLREFNGILLHWTLESLSS